MKNLFVNNLTKSNTEIKATRAERIAKATEKSQRTLVDKLDAEVDALKAHMEDLEDLSPDTELSLQPVKDGEFNSDKWCAEMQRTQIALLNKELELQIAKATYAKYFTEEEEEEEEEAKSKKD